MTLNEKNIPAKLKLLTIYGHEQWVTVEPGWRLNSLRQDNSLLSLIEATGQNLKPLKNVINFFLSSEVTLIKSKRHSVLTMGF